MCDHSLESCRAVLYCDAVCLSRLTCSFEKFINFGISLVRSESIHSDERLKLETSFVDSFMVANLPCQPCG